MRLWNTITYFEICAGDQIKYCRIVGIPSKFAKLLNSLVHTEEDAVVLFPLFCLLCKIILLKGTLMQI